MRKGDSRQLAGGSWQRTGARRLVANWAARKSERLQGGRCSQRCEGAEVRGRRGADGRSEEIERGGDGETRGSGERTAGSLQLAAREARAGDWGIGKPGERTASSLQ